mmetsp:Transcript_31653/g.50550  ORF Transcript_31653/g.50550 Transcript_31653/m.50550 type:complete len:214 (-) Transcript_31653:2463-3104(-)
MHESFALSRGGSFAGKASSFKTAGQAAFKKTKVAWYILVVLLQLSVALIILTVFTFGAVLRPRLPEMVGIQRFNKTFLQQIERSDLVFESKYLDFCAYGLVGLVAAIVPIYQLFMLRTRAAVAPTNVDGNWLKQFRAATRPGGAKFWNVIMYNQYLNCFIQTIRVLEFGGVQVHASTVFDYLPYNGHFAGQYFHINFGKTPQYSVRAVMANRG